MHLVVYLPTLGTRESHASGLKTSISRMKDIFSRLHRRTGRGDEGGCSPPNFGQLGFFGQQEKIWAKPGFKDVSMFFYYFEEINNFYFNLKKNPEVGVIIQLHSLETLVA